MIRTGMAAAVAVCFAASAAAEESFQYRVATEINASRKCRTPDPQRAGTECAYSFKGIRLLLVLDSRDPQNNTFVVESVSSDKDTFLKFGGVHSCAIISHYGKSGEMAHVFISRRTGDVYTTWHVPACAK